MGAWGTGNFDNDDACDWSYKLEATSDLALIIDTIDNVFKEDYLDAETCCEALAAIETVSRLRGNWGTQNSYTNVVDDWVKINSNLIISEDVIAQCDKVITRILGESSELRELWEESKEFDIWKNDVLDLRNRIYKKAVPVRPKKKQLPRLLYKLLKLYDDDPDEKIRIKIKNKIINLKDVNDGGNETNYLPPIVLTSRFGLFEETKLLLERGADPNNGGMFDFSAFSSAVAFGHIEVAKLLLDAGATFFCEISIDAKTGIRVNNDNDNKNVDVKIVRLVPALISAAENGNPETLDFLLSLGADIHQLDLNGDTLLHKASRKGNVETAKYLIKLGIDIDRVTSFNETSIQSAVLYNKIEIVKLLLESGADPNIVSIKDTGEIRWKMTALDMAEHEGSQEIIKLVKDHGGLHFKDLK